MPVKNPRRGNNAIEFALIFPVIVLLAFGVMDWSFYFVQWQTSIAAAQAGARRGSQTAMSSGPAAAAEAEAALAFSTFTPRAVVGVTYVGSIVNPDIVRITVTAPYAKLIGITPMPTSCTATAQMRVTNLL